MCGGLSDVVATLSGASKFAHAVSQEDGSARIHLGICTFSLSELEEHAAFVLNWGLEAKRAFEEKREKLLNPGFAERSE